MSLFVFSLLFLNCNQFGNNKVTDDSLHYTPPAPAVLDQNEFNRYYQSLNLFFDSTLLSKGFNGGILVARGGEILYEKYQGLADLRKKNLAARLDLAKQAGQADYITDSTSLHIASSTKTFTSLAVLRMVQKGKLSLNDTITKFFPGLPYPGITIKMLLSHRSGLPNYLYFLPDSNWDKNKFAVNADVLNFLISNKPGKSFSAGSRFSYSNTNYVLLALVIEKISGRTFPDYMQHEFFGPLDMKHTFVFTLKDTLRATPTFSGNGTYWNLDFLDGTYGDKNIYTTPRDLLKWDQALYTDQLISLALLDSAFTGYSLEKPSIHNYGLGWRILTLPNAKKVVYHFGKWHGSNAAFARLTEEKVTVIILGNKFMRSIYNAARLCYDIFGDYHQSGGDEEEESDSLTTVKKAVVPALKKKKPPPGKKIVLKPK